MMQQKVKTTRAPGLRLDKNRRLTPMQIYCWATVVCLAVLLLALLASRGALLHRFFFYDVTDTGMDFFHSIEYMRGRMPYGQFDTLYPPLANLFFYVLYLLVPKTQSATWTESFISSLNMKGTERDLRLQQATMMLFIVFVIVVVLGIVSMTERLTRSCGGRKELLAFCAVFSYGVLYGLERGNILLLCWPLMAFFILYRNSENPLLRELACLALAIAAGFKLYPAFLGVLLLRDKNYLAAVRTVLYGVVCLCFPLFFFNEGLFGLTLWFRVLFDFSGSRGEPWIGNGFSNILAEAGHAVDKLLGTQLGYGSYALLGIVLAAVLLVCSFFMDKEWKRITAIILAMLMFQSQYDYVWCLFLIPLFLFMEQERELRSDNVLPYLALMVPVLPLPLFRRELPAFLERGIRWSRPLYRATRFVMSCCCCSLSGALSRRCRGCVYAVRKSRSSRHTDTRQPRCCWPFVWRWPVWAASSCGSAPTTGALTTAITADWMPRASSRRTCRTATATR